MLIKALGGSTVVRLVGMGLSFIVGVQLARGLGTDGYGTYGLAMSVIALLMIPTEFGLPILVVRETAASVAGREWAKFRGLLRWSARFIIGTSLLVSLVVVGLLLLGPALAGRSLEATLIFGLPLVPLVALAKTRGAALSGLRMIVRGQVPDSIIRPGMHSLLLLVATVFAIKVTPELAMGCGVVAAAAALASAALMLRRAIPGEVRNVAPDSRGREWRSSCLPMAMTEGMRTVQGHVVLLILGAMASVSAVGLYKVAVAVNLLIATPTGIFIAVSAPLISELASTGERDRLQRLLSWTSAGMVTATLAMSVPVLVAGPYLLGRVFGEEFRDAAVPLQILCVGAILTATAGTAGTLLNMTGHERHVRRASFRSFLLLSAVLPVFVWFWGVIGAALASVVASFFWRQQMAQACRRILELEPGLWDFLKGGR